MELKHLPSGWKTSSLELISAFITKGSTPTTFGFRWESSGIPFLRSECVSEGGLDLSQSMFISPKTHAVFRRSNITDGDILITITGYVGRVVLLSGVGEANMNQHIARIRVVSDDVTVGYVYHVLSQPASRAYFASITTGQAYPQIGLRQVRDAQIPLPPPDEQRKIAEALTDVDRLVGELERLIAKKRDLKQAAMQQLLTEQTRLPGFHGDWGRNRLGDLVYLIPSGIYGDEKFQPGLAAFPVATTANIDEGDSWNEKEMPIRYFSPEKIQRYATKTGDLIVVKSSGSAARIQSGKIGFIDRHQAGNFLFSNFLMLLRPTGVVPIFLYFYLCSHNVKKLLPTLVEASTYPNIRLADYLDVEIPVPTHGEQIAIAKVLTDMDAELVALEKRRDKFRVLKQAMMQELLTGRTRLR